ncbi:MAG: LuxR C-terminal-related transcriptional regulator [Chloroflexi bacterium]|nr:LuxR C-terminal-related transcriptional regulator [Chloroflexota bacterium]
MSILTPRQREIAGLLARGLPNANIAQQLVLTTGTVANHVASILQRLQLDSGQLSAYLAQVITGGATGTWLFRRSTGALARSTPSTWSL